MNPGISESKSLVRFLTGSHRDVVRRPLIAQTYTERIIGMKFEFDVKSAA
jgi:hypothetical protein